MGDETVEEIKQRKLEALRAAAEQPAVPDEPVQIDAGERLTELFLTHSLVLVDCYADWCGPCKQLEPIVERIAAETDIVVAAVDVDAHPDMAAEWSVRGVPTLVLFKDGRPLDRKMGVHSFEDIKDWIETAKSAPSSG